MPKDEKTTVGELIAALRTMPTDMRVVVPGVETGYDDITVAAGVKDVCIGVTPRRDSFNGTHQDMDTVERVDPDNVLGYKRETVVVLRHG